MSLKVIFICENSLFQDIFSIQNLILLKIYVNTNIIDNWGVRSRDTEGAYAPPVSKQVGHI